MKASMYRSCSKLNKVTEKQVTFNLDYQQVFTETHLQENEKRQQQEKRYIVLFYTKSSIV